VIEKAGLWFFPPLASMITSAGRLLLAMTEECVNREKGTYLFCDTDSLAIVSAKDGGPLKIPGVEGHRILPWAETQRIANKFISLNPYDRKAVKGSILNLVDANYVDSDPRNHNASSTATASPRNAMRYTKEPGNRASQLLIQRRMELAFSTHPKILPRTGGKKYHAGLISFGMTSYDLR
jgi:hypothetical protein